MEDPADMLHKLVLEDEPAPLPHPSLRPAIPDTGLSPAPCPSPSLTESSIQVPISALKLADKLHHLVLEDTPPPVDTLTECFRSLRNNCAGNPEVQNSLAESALLSDTNTAIGKSLDMSGEEWTLCLRITAQFLGNLIVNNHKNQEIVWNKCRSQLKRMAQHGDEKLTNICLMVFYNILLGCPYLTRELVNDQELVRIVCTSGAEGLEFAQYIAEHLLSLDTDWTKVYKSDIPVAGRIFLLELFEGKVKESADRVSKSLVTQLASQFCQHSACILRTVADKVATLEPVEVALLLQLLASCTAHSFPALQEDRNFFINCAFLLKGIHMASKEEGNCFSAIHKLSATNDEMQNHPAFGFKANLVRVLGNLCWKHKYNQDQLRELEIIPILLDCCNIDARNPFIIQWVVLAVRNLCEGNRENQELIASMSRQGLVESAVLSELGVTLHADGDNSQIRIAPLNTNR